MASAALIGIFIGLAFAVANGSMDELKRQVKDIFGKDSNEER
jgi:ABC-type dipeptide/oligopeptide/nickel transport system permease subunit